MADNVETQTQTPAPSPTPSPTAGVTYICIATIQGQEDSSVCLVCHYNDGNLERHIEETSKDVFDYHGYVYDPSDPLPDYSNPTIVLGKNPKMKIEGKFCEALLQPDHPDHTHHNLNPYTMFVRFMINPEAEHLDWITKEGHGFPVGWAVRGYLPEELARRNLEWQKKHPNDELKNAMNLLPVFRADFEDLHAKCPKDWGDCKGVQTLERAYYITTQTQYQRLKPKSLRLQIKEAGPDPLRSNDDPMDIAAAHQNVQVRET